ncbi:MAG: coenzyme F420-0:L-glutamate ligase [Acidobacteria bacterium]|nr:MAG: coenzyme F420-0:L-glutamate ligase [Acidobacteriota bacterium]
MANRLQLFALPGIPEVRPGDDLAQLLCDGLERADLVPTDGDVVAIAQKIVSKAEGRIVHLREIEPSQRAIELAREVDKDPRLVEVILGESTEVVRHRAGVLVVAHRLGLVLANAGVDHSNVAGDEEIVLLLPEDPDASARRLQQELSRRYASHLGVLINDSLGRAWRLGTVGVAIGCAGFSPLLDLRGEPDRHGRALRVSVVGHADELAAAASIVMGQGAEGTPAVLIRGLEVTPGAPARDLVRPVDEDLFR